MSDVAPSFFPTPHEIAGGIRWMRDHPVVATAAAAAATAVSVFTYLKSRVDDDSDDCCAEPSSKDTPTRERFQTWSDSYEPQDGDPRAASLVKATSASRSSDALVQTQTKRTDASDDVYSSTESDVSTTSPTVRRSHPSSSSFACGFQDTPNANRSDTVHAKTLSPSSAATTVPFSTSVNDSGVPTALRFGFPESVLEEDDDTTSASPQWGWYVSTTPPEERYS